jgi:hypothetical protein
MHTKARDLPSDSAIADRLFLFLAAAVLAGHCLVACGSAGFSPGGAQKQMRVLQANTEAYAVLAEQTGDAEGAEAAIVLSQQVEMASDALDAYLVGSGSAGGVWAALEGVVSIADQIVLTASSDGLKRAAFIVGAAARQAQIAFPETPNAGQSK